MAYSRLAWGGIDGSPSNHNWFVSPESPRIPVPGIPNQTFSKNSVHGKRMIPNIFVSSTIADLHYLRDGLCDAIDELCYHPVMSEHGEVGYLHPNTAAESCYRSVGQCQMVVLIVGKRYGSTGEDGLSVTHREFLAAKSDTARIITFVEPEILSYKEVFCAGTERYRRAHVSQHG